MTRRAKGANVTLRRAASGVLALCAAVAVVGLGISSVAAQPTRDGPVQIALPGRDFTAHPDGPLLHATQLAPGGATDATMGIRNNTGHSGDVTIAATHISATEGCAVDADDCTHGRPDAADSLQFSIAVADTPAGQASPVWAGTISQLAIPVTLQTAVPPSGELWMRLTAALPTRTPNQAQGDAVHFALRVAIGSATAEVGPAQTHRRSAGIPALARTGFGRAVLVTVAVVAIALGSLIAYRGRRAASPHSRTIRARRPLGRSCR